MSKFIPPIEFLQPHHDKVFSPKGLRLLMTEWRIANMQHIPVEWERDDAFDYFHREGVIVETGDGKFRIDCKRPLILDRLYEMRKRTAETIAYYVERDLEGDELLMKEVWEDCRTDEEKQAAKGELKAIIEWLSKRYPEKSRR